jgi:uncharacterized membrane protein YhhN
MTRQSWIFLFIIAVLADIAGGIIKNDLVDYIFKPLIVISLVGYFVSETNYSPSPLKKWVFLALVFSWIGDVLLLLQQVRPIFFLLGLSSFLLAHVFYIVFFHEVRVLEKVKLKLWLMLIVVIYYVGLMGLLSPHLHDMKTPVRIYGIAISFMLMLAMHMAFIKRKMAGWEMVIGACLFLISDSVLAINNYYHSFSLAGTIIMLTYGLAQLLIVDGAIKYITSEIKE